MIEEYTLFILIIQFILLSFFLIIFFKKYKNIFNENSIVKPLNDKIDKLNSTADKIFTLKNEIFSERSILQKHLSDLQTSLEKINASMLDINNILNSESSSNFRFASLTRNNTQNKLEKSDFAADVKSNFINKETRIIEEGISNNNNFEINSTHTNNSTNELKALEKEIFTALKRLENTESNSESNKK